MLDCTVPRASAAAEKLPVSAMPTRACRCFRSMPTSRSGVQRSGLMGAIVNRDDKYLIKLIDRLADVPQNGSQTAGIPDSPPPFLSAV
jgi:hypothetical protein